MRRDASVSLLPPRAVATLPLCMTFPPYAPCVAASSDTTSQRIVNAALRLLKAEGRHGVTVRAVAAAAGVQAPAIYRTFGDMYGLFSALATMGFHHYLERKRAVDIEDPVEALRAAWDVHVQFGLDEPELYLLMYGDPTRITHCDAADEAWGMLTSHLERIAKTGLLTMPVTQAAELVQSASMGVTLTLVGQDPSARHPRNSEVLREATLAAILADAQPTPPAPAASLAVALSASLDGDVPLTPGQRAMLSEMLDAIASSHRD